MTPFFENKKEGVACRRTPRTDFPPHLHAPVELYYVLQGEAELLVGGERRSVCDGGLAVIFPGQVHAYRTLRPGSCIMAILSPALAPKVQEVFLRYLPVRPFLQPEELPAHLAETLCELADTQDAALCAALAQLALTRLARALELRARTPYEADDLLARAVDAIGQNYREDLGLRGLAAQLSVSEWHLSRTLGTGLGMSFRTYVNSLRVADACSLLESGEGSVVQAAFECGFQNLRTFNRAFGACMGCTPGEYRRRARLGAERAKEDRTSGD